MSQLSFSDAEYAGKRKMTRREVVLEEMEQVVPWQGLLKVGPFYPVAGPGRRPYPMEAMLRVHLMQNWVALSDPAMEEALYEIASLRNFAGLKLSESWLPLWRSSPTPRTLPDRRGDRLAHGGCVFRCRRFGTRQFRRPAGGGHRGRDGSGEAAGAVRLPRSTPPVRRRRGLAAGIGGWRSG